MEKTKWLYKESFIKSEYLTVHHILRFIWETFKFLNTLYFIFLFVFPIIVSQICGMRICSSRRNKLWTSIENITKSIFAFYKYWFGQF